MAAAPSVIVHKSAEDNGMAAMVADLIRTNVGTSAYKARCFTLIKATVGVVVTDAEVSATLAFNRGSCVIYDGVAGRTDLTIEADSESILQLSNLSLVLGLPYYLDQTGIDILGKTIGGQVRIRGMVCHPVTLTLLTIVLSVN
jgi:hypothetical protein